MAREKMLNIIIIIIICMAHEKMLIIIICMAHEKMLIIIIIIIICMAREKMMMMMMIIIIIVIIICMALGRVAQSVRCLATDASLDCRSRGREFDPGLVPYFHGDWSWNNFYCHSPPFHWIIQEGLLSVTSESMCTKYWLTACSSLPRKKCG